MKMASATRVVGSAFLALAWTACKGGDGGATSGGGNGPPCATVLAAIDRFAAGELFPGASTIGNRPSADGKPFEVGNRPVRFADLAPPPIGPPLGRVGPADGTPVYVLADADMKAERVKQLASDEDEYRLVVKRPLGMPDVWKMVEEGAPPPKSLADWWTKVKSKAETDGLGLDVIGPEIADGLLRTAGRCRDAVSAATGALAKGELGMGAAEALRAELPKCKCEGMDEPGFSLVVALVLVTSNPRLSWGWLPVDKNVFAILPPDATVEALAARLASKEPIPIPPDAAPPPPPPPPPPPVRQRAAEPPGP